MSLLVLEPGLESRIVDLGRPRTRSLGVPVGGAADRRALMLGNALVGNPPGAAALEVTLKGPRLRAECDIAGVLIGSPFQLHMDGYPIDSGHTFTLRAGQELVIGGASVGARAYLCIHGGVQTPVILASRSALAPLQKGDRLPCEPGRIHARTMADTKQLRADATAVSVLAGQQGGWFDEAEFLQQTFKVTPACNRMGLRLQGTPLTMPRREMISEPVCPGAVQVTPDGQCIVLGVDGQTIGGYPKIAQVIQADLDVLGQLRPGQSISFTRVTLEEAIARDREAAAELRLWTTRLQLSLDAFAVERKFSWS